MGVEPPNKSKLNTFHSNRNYYLADGKYNPNPKHDKNGWGSPNPITDKKEGQDLIDTGLEIGRQIYNITEKGDIVKYQPDNTPEKGYHPYKIYSNKDLPVEVIKEWVKTGRISKSEYNKLRKGKTEKVKVPKK